MCAVLSREVLVHEARSCDPSEVEASSVFVHRALEKVIARQSNSQEMVNWKTKFDQFLYIIVSRIAEQDVRTFYLQLPCLGPAVFLL